MIREIVIICRSHWEEVIFIFLKPLEKRLSSISHVPCLDYEVFFLDSFQILCILA
ncbi:hypothetical protein M6B38_335325 [Iris pallida]|uniref:Uncharacterized protein n=1 Tax=Iris pallida TaxID=29817 RepID=A0AAX6H151_IRIPA|nr:hypothetical protein M6B38_335325 [Iris pallida]